MLEYPIFAAVALGVYLGQEIIRRRSLASLRIGSGELSFYRGLSLVFTGLFVLLLAVGWFFTSYQEQEAKEHLHEDNLINGAIIANQMERIGHAAIGPATPADDARHREMMSMLTAWIRADTKIERVYTLRRAADGSLITVLGTPNNQNVTPADRVGPSVDDSLTEGIPALNTAFSGLTSYQQEPVNHLGEKTVSAFLPLHDSNGSVEAVLAIDYNIARWEQDMLFARLTGIGLVFGVLLLLNSVYWVIYRAATDRLRFKIFQAEVIESETRFRRLANDAPVLLQVVDATGRPYFFNQTWQGFLGLSQDDLLAGGWLEAVHPDDRLIFGKHLLRALNQREPLQCEFRLKKDDGKYCWMMATCTPRWQDNVFAGYMGTFVDITAHRELEEALGRQVAFEQLAAAISGHFLDVSAEDFDRAIMVALGEVARFAGVERSSVAFFAESGAVMSCTHEWCAPQIKPLRDLLQEHESAEFYTILSNIAAEGGYLDEKLADTTLPAAESQQLLRAQGFQSLCIVPMSYVGRLLGFLALESQSYDRKWAPEDVNLLKLMAEIFVTARERNRAETALARSEAQNRAIIELVPDYLLRVSRDGMVLDFRKSKHYLMPLGYHDFVGRHLSELLPTHLRKTAADTLIAAMTTGEVQIYEYYIVYEGKTIYLEARVTATDEDTALVIVRDVSERKQSEACDLLLLDMAVKVLEEEPLEEVLTLACEQILAIFGLKLMWVARKEPNGAISLFSPNEETREYLGEFDVRWDDSTGGQGATGEAIRSGKFQLWELDSPAYPDEWRERFRQYGVSSAVSFPLKVGGEILGALTLLAPNKEVWTKRTIVHLTNFAEQIAVAINNTSGRQQLKLLNAGLEAAANAILIMSRQGEIQWVNPAFLELTGYTWTEIAGQKVAVVLESGKYPRNFYRALWRDLEEGLSWNGEVVNRRKDGSPYTAEMTVTPVRDEDGEISNYIFIIQDVTQRKETEREMLEARETVARAERLSSLGIMAAGIAHEINQPLNSLKVMADGMLYWYNQGKVPEMIKVMDNVQKISKQADRIDQIIKHMRSFVRSSQTVETVPCDVNESVNEALTMVGAQLNSHGIALRLKLAARLPKILANSTQLEEVIINLTVNAMQALDTIEQQDKVITVETRYSRGDVIVEISDNGPGIERKIKNKIFEPFFSTKLAGEGMGLGLSIVHSIVTSYGGQITAKSRQAGGATFRVEFPALTESKEEESDCISC